MLNRFIMISLMVGLLLIGCQPKSANHYSVQPDELLKTHYLVDQEYVVDDRNLFATLGHLRILNPGERDAELKVTLYFENEEPQSFPLTITAKTNAISDYKTWPIRPKPNSIFSLKIDSSEPIICQSTIGWNNTANDYAPSALTKSPKGIRETAKSSMAINQLSQEWYIADGIVIDQPDTHWIRESEWLMVLNPTPQDAQIKLFTYFTKEVFEESLTIPGNRVKRVYMDDRIKRRNSVYGAKITSSSPIAVQWLRTVNWYDSPELMANWSVPAVAKPLQR